MSNTKHTVTTHPKALPEDVQLVKDLMEISARKTGRRALVKSSVYDAPSDPEIKVRSWKMDEFKYYDVPSPFPSLVRGLFTVDVPGKEPSYRIVCRGYDKFFNIGEVPWTTWDSIEHHTAAPYTLSLKSNGCIIFIGALTPEKLIVTSKHALGPMAGKTTHSGAGEAWLHRYFDKKGRTEAEMAQVLWDNNWTAIAELCDDDFEEHVLAVPPELTGLHLHGINTCTKEFKTMPQDVVDAFADEWGFIKTLCKTMDTVEEVKRFTAKVGEVGHWNGQTVEGFVVRTHVTEPPTNKQKSKSPYTPGSTFFFKIKFDEPYMMYRDWREVTKSLLSMDLPRKSALPKSKMRRRETQHYVDWIIKEIKRDRKQFSEYSKGHGIIATRERFLEYMRAGGHEVDLSSRPASPALTNFGKTIIVPVAIPGCGKTTVAVALAHIFGWGHTQSDDVTAKKAAPVFLKNVKQAMQKNDIVIADKNNHLKQHRDQLRDLRAEFSPPARLLALNWSSALSAHPPAMLHRICGDRVLLRGDNHQSLHGDSITKAHEKVIWQFIKDTQELAQSEVDACVDMEIDETMEQSIRRAVEGCVQVLGLEMPSEEKIASGIEKATGYAPKTTGKGKGKTAEPAKKKAAKPPRYFGLVPEMNALQAFEGPMSGEAFWEKLKEGKRVKVTTHATVVHSKGLPEAQALWDRCMALHTAPLPPLFQIKLKNMVWNDRIMAATVDNMTVVADGRDTEQKGAEFVKELPQEAWERLHITIATLTDSVNPFEAKTLVENFRKGKAGPEVKSKALGDVVVEGRITGLFS
ncbi:hypothetical protein CYLTODRAFT_436728 [Cylindrobasidium torrendii FP15055 ss-10]|uniref:tRNA ligase n=1 Tax=Cylindrobasidium torrendii FP15055 ss-10 TaxID=1314674 RepID=A0A0D7BER1_9AGAR|nr:hypothetical protein CYLTODRAFT_436728 [Cylindrobasidium torrendii FP15055 ss-10]